MISSWSCDNSNASTSLCTVTATSSDASLLAFHGELGTLIFGQAVLILFGTFIVVGMLWNALKFNKRS